jgi:hypothetical protein
MRLAITHSPIHHRQNTDIRRNPTVMLMEENRLAIVRETTMTSGTTGEIVARGYHLATALHVVRQVI